MSFQRVSARRLEVIRTALREADIAVLHFLAEMRLATGFQIARRLWAAPAPRNPRARSARRALARLEEHRLIERLGRRVGGVRGGSTSIVYGLAPAGRRLLPVAGHPKRLGTPGERHVRHILDVTELVVQLHEATLAGELELLEARTEPACWRPFHGPFGAQLILKPDAYVRIAAGRRNEDRWFVEVDRATESLATIRTKLDRYLTHLRSGVEQQTSGVYPRVVWTVPNSRRRDHLRAIIEGLPGPGPRLFSVWLFDEMVGRLAAEAKA